MKKQQFCKFRNEKYYKIKELKVEKIKHKLVSFVPAAREYINSSFIFFELQCLDFPLQFSDSFTDGSIQRSTSPPEICPSETIRYLPETWPLPLQILWFCFNWYRYSFRYSIFSSQCRWPSCSSCFCLLHQPELLQGIESFFLCSLETPFLEHFKWGNWRGFFDACFLCNTNSVNLLLIYCLLVYSLVCSNYLVS